MLETNIRLSKTLLEMEKNDNCSSEFSYDDRYHDRYSDKYGDRYNDRYDD